MNKKLLILAFVLLAGLTVSAQQIERVGRNVPGRGPGFQLPPLPEHVVLSLRDTSARTFEGRSSNNAPLFFIYPDAALDSVSAAALVSELGLPDIVRDFHFSEEDLAYLASLPAPAGGKLFKPGFLEYLRTFKLDVGI